MYSLTAKALNFCCEFRLSSQCPRSAKSGKKSGEIRKLVDKPYRVAAQSCQHTVLPLRPLFFNPVYWQNR